VAPTVTVMKLPHTRRTVLRGAALTGLGTAAVLSLRTAASGVSPSAVTALSAATGCATLTKEETQGPFWVDERLQRSDVRADSETGAVHTGVPLTLTINLQDAGAGCAPQVGAYVDIWHANAQGAYSDVSGQGNPDNIGVDWLRGYQVSDANGSVTFTTIFPGWYTGRTAHIHFRIRLALDTSTTVNFTSQLYFEESVATTVYATSAYAKSGTRQTNSTDSLYDAGLLMPVTGSTTAGYAGAFTVALDFGDGTTDSTTGTTTATTTGSDQRVRARVRTARVVRRRGRRVVEVDVAAHERVAAKVRLVRHDDVLAQRSRGWLAKGRHTLRVAVPRGVDPGTARVVVNLADAAGNTRITRKRVTL
jgi:protocatechuate 3,4-dioxygenase beta subunit